MTYIFNYFLKLYAQNNNNVFKMRYFFIMCIKRNKVPAKTFHFA